VFDQCRFVPGVATCKRKRTREVLVFPEGGGDSCVDASEEEPCACPKVCGDGHTVEGEECDDGNTYAAVQDGCSDTCTIQVRNNL
jgi:cysteine-rich repeat protein